MGMDSVFHGQVARHFIKEFDLVTQLAYELFHLFFFCEGRLQLVINNCILVPYFIV